VTLVAFTKRGTTLAAAIWLALGAAALAAEPDDIFERERLGGDFGGLRPILADMGLDVGVQYSGETFGVASGGVRRGLVYDGRLMLSLDADFAKLAGWQGAKAHLGAYQIHGSGPSAELLGGNLMTVSNIEARPNTRLNTLWLEQSAFDEAVAVRVGQLAADDEFMISDTATIFLNGTFGWPPLTAADTTAGGPADPLASSGLRLKVKPAGDVAILAAVFAGNPGGEGCTGDPQICDRHGTVFSLGGGALWMMELQYAPKDGALGLPGSYKIGAWRETGTFADQLTGLLHHRGDYGVYAIADQMVWRRTGTEDDGVSLFLRLGVAPSDRNLVAWYADAGLAYKGPFAGRPDDVVALGVAYARINGNAADADRAAGPPTPVRDYEAVLEVSYKAALARWWSVQPDVQYVLHPGGNVAAPNGSGTIRNAVALGLRTTISF
jgi:porin